MIYIEKLKLNFADTWLISLDCVTNRNLYFWFKDDWVFLPIFLWKLFLLNNSKKCHLNSYVVQNCTCFNFKSQEHSILIPNLEIDILTAWQICYQTQMKYKKVGLGSKIFEMIAWNILNNLYHKCVTVLKYHLDILIFLIFEYCTYQLDEQCLTSYNVLQMKWWIYFPW